MKLRALSRNRFFAQCQHWFFSQRREKRAGTAPVLPVFGTIEALESRIAPAVTAALNGTVLTLIGDGAGDTLTLHVNGSGNIEFKVGAGSFSDDLDTATGGTQQLAISAATKINISMDGGVDSVVLDNTAAGGFVGNANPGFLISVDGGGNSDSLTVITPSGTHALTLTPGVASDAGSIQVDSVQPISFSNLGASGSVNLQHSGGRADSLTFNGSGGNDTFNVASGAGAITLNAGISVTTAGVSDLTLNGLEGDDIFNLNASQPYNTIKLSGGGASTVDQAYLTGDASSSLNVAMGFNGISPTPTTITGGGFTSVTTGGIGSLTVNNGAGDIKVSAGANNDSFSITPINSTWTHIQADNRDPLDLFTVNSGTLTVDTGAGNDTVSVYASSASETIGVSDTNVAISGVKTVNFTNNESVVVYGLAGADTFNVTPSATVQISVDGGDPIGSSPGDSVNVIAGSNAVKFNPGPLSDQGSLTVGSMQPVSFIHIEHPSITGSVGSSLTIAGTNGPDTVTIVGTGTHAFDAAVNDGPTIHYDGVAAFTIDTGNGSDSISITPYFGAGGWKETVTVLGGSPTTGSDELLVQGSSGQETVNYSPGSTATLQINGGAGGANTGTDISISGIEHFTYDGLLGNDQVTNTSPAGQNTETVMPGATTDAAKVITDQFLPIDLANLGSTGKVLLKDFAGAQSDILKYVGNFSQDNFSLDQLGNIFLNNQIPVQGVNVIQTTLDALTNQNVFKLLDGTNPFAGLSGLPGLNLLGNSNSIANLFTSAFGGQKIDLNGLSGLISGFGGGLGLGGIQLPSQLSQLLFNNGGGAFNTFDLSNIGYGDIFKSLNLLGNSNSGIGDILNIAGTVASDVFAFTPVGAALGVAGGLLQTFGAGGALGGLLGPVMNFSDIFGDLFLDGGGGTDITELDGTSGNDTFLLKGDTGADNDHLPSVSQNGEKAIKLKPGLTTNLAINGAAGNDTLTVDSTNGAFTKPVQFDGGADADSIVLQGGTASLSTYSVGPNIGSGTLSLAITGAGAGNESVSFTNVEPVLDTVAGPAVINATNANNAINYTQGSSAAKGLVTVDDQESYEFSNKTKLTINALSGDDVINLNNPNTPTGLNTNGIFVDGGDPTASDTVIVNGSSSQDTITFKPTAFDAATVTGAQPVLVTITTAEAVVINGLGGGDLLHVQTPAGVNVVTYTPGNTVDAASVQVDSLVPMSFKTIGSTGNVFIDDFSGTRVDTLIYNGTSADDTFTVGTTGGIDLNSHVPPAPTIKSQIHVSTPGVANLTLNGLDGNDTFNVTGAQPFANITLAGGLSTGVDTANLTGDGTAAFVTMGAAVVNITGGGLGTTGMILLGVEVGNLSDSAGNISIYGSTAQDSIHVTPTAANSAKITFDGFSTTLNTTNTGKLTIVENHTGDNDLLIFHGTGLNDTINVVRDPSDTTVQNVGLKLVHITTADVESLYIAAGGGDDTINVSGTGGPVLTVDGGLHSNGDTLNIFNTTAGSSTVTPGATGDAGVVSTPDGDIAFLAIEALAITATAGTDTLNVLGTNGNDSITLQDIGGKDTVWVNDRAPVSFSAFETLNLNANNGDDQISVTPTGLSNVLTAINVNTGLPTASDKVVINGTSGSDLFTVTGMTFDSAIVVFNAVPIAVSGTELLVIDGQQGGDTVNIVSPAGPDVVTLTPDIQPDAGTVNIAEGGTQALLPVRFQHVGSNGILVLSSNSNAPEDTLIYNGTAASDLFTVAATTGNIQLNQQTLVQTPGISDLVLNGLDGDDTFTVNAPSPYTTTLITGGDPSHTDIVNLNGDGNAATVNLGSPTATVVGGGLGIVSLTGDEILNLNALGGNITFKGTNGPDQFDITPTGANTATVFSVGFEPVVNTTNTGLLTVAEGNTNDGDVVTVHGTTQNDTIDITRGNDTTVLVTSPAGDLKLIHINPASETEALVVDGNLGDDNFNVSGSGGPALTVNGNLPLSKPAGDTLTVIGGTGANAFTVTPGDTSDSGSVQLNNDVTQFMGIENVVLDGGTGDGGGTASSATILGTSESDDFVVTIHGGDSADITQSDHVPITLISFFQDSTININSLEGDDKTSIVIATNNDSNFTTINVDGGQPTASDTLVVNGVPVHQDFLQIQPTGTGAGFITDNTAAFPTVFFTGTEHLVMVGQSSIEKDGLIENLGPSDNTLEIAPGATPDSGTITGFTNGTNDNFAFVPIAFSGFLGFLVTPGTVPHPGTHTLIVDGTGADDTFNFGSAAPFGPDYPAIIVNTGANAHVPIFYSASLTEVVLRGLDGNDVFNTNFTQANVTSPVHLRIEGGGSPGDLLNYTTAADANVILDLGAGTLVSTGANLIEFSGLATINEFSSGNTILQVRGSSGPDNLHFTPTGATAGTLISDELNLAYNFSGVGGAFTIDAKGGADTVTVNGTSAGDNISIVRGSITNVQVGSLKSVGIFTDAAEAIVVEAGLGNDTITVSGFDGPLTSGLHPALVVDGGGSFGDKLIVNVPTGTTTVTPGTSVDSGTISAPQNANVSFTTIESVTINGTDPNADELVVQGTQGSDTIAAANVGSGNQVFVNDRAPVTFTNFVTLSLDGRFGDDSFSITGAGLTSVKTINVNGGDPTASDSLIVNATSAADVIAFNPTSFDAGNVKITGLPTVNFTTTESVIINGLGGGDALTVTTPAGAQTITYTTGNTPDSGAAQIASLVAMSFKNLGANSSLTFADVSSKRVDAFIYNGTGGNDTFTFNNGVIALNGQLAPAMPGVADLTLNGLDGDETFNVVGSGPFNSLTLAGGDPSASDIANLTGDGTAVTVSIGGATSSVTGGGLGTVLLSGVEIANLADGAGAITIKGTTGADSFSFTPTGATTATIQANGVSPIVNTTNTGSLTVDPAGGADLITISSNAAANVIGITLGTTTTVVVDAQKTIGILSSHTEVLDVLAGDGNDTVTISGTGGSLLTVDAGTGDDSIDASHVTITGITILGGTGNDTIIGGGGPDRLFGNDGNDTITGGPGSDQMFGGDGSDTFNWNSGDGSDLIEGEAGNNLLVFNGSSVAENFVLTANGTRISLASDVGPVNMNIAGVQQIDLHTGNGADSVTANDLSTTDIRVLNIALGASQTDAVTVFGRTTADSLQVTSPAAKTLNVAGLNYDVNVTNVASTGSFTLNGNNGDDNLQAAIGVESVVKLTLDGGAGNDFVSGGGTLLGGDGNDKLVAVAGNVVLDGGNGDDILVAGPGDDTLKGGAGNDTLIGGPGADTFDGGTGYDIIPLTATSANDTVDLTQPNAGHVVYTLNGTAKTLPIANIEEIHLDAGAGDDSIKVTQSDSLVANAGASVRFSINGGDATVGNRLAVVDDGLGDTMIYRQAQDQTAGSISVGPLGTVYFSNIEFVQPISGGTDGDGKLLVFKHDSLESDNSILTAAHLGAGTSLNADPNIDPGADVGLGLPADQDFYRVESIANGKLDFQLFFQKLGTLANGRAGLPGDGALRIDAFDSHGNFLASSTASGTGADLHFMAVAGQVFYFKVSGATADAINSYDVTVLDTALPPFSAGGPGKNGAGDPASFTASVNYPVGKAPRAVVAGDLNGDGFADMIVANSGKNTISIRLGRGDGTFDAPTTISSGGIFPNSLALADANQDGNLDLVVANRNSNNVVVRLGDGFGDFGTAKTFGLSGGQAPISVKVADLNGDSKPDIVTANAKTNNISVLLGNGNGTFSAASNFKTGGKNPRDIALADFNHDSNLDIVIANAKSNNVSFMPGDGAGHFKAPTLFAVGKSPVSLAVGDFNSDGDADVVVANGSSSFESVLIGSGLGGSLAFERQVQVKYPRELKPQGVAVGDFNFDGHDDIVLTNLHNQSISVLLGNDNGTFSNPFNFHTSVHRGQQPSSIAVVDLNNDGLVDFLITNTNTNDISVLLRSVTI